MGLGERIYVASRVSAVHLMPNTCNAVWYINMHYFAFGTMQYSKFKSASNADFAIAM